MAHSHNERPTLNDFIAELEASGCAVSDLSGPMHGPRGAIKVRYAKNATTQKFAVLPNIPLDERLTMSVIEGIERRLGVKTKYSG